MPVAEPQIHNRPSYPHVIAVTSGKGGVGKSSIAVNLGLSLAKSGARVCILDADTGLANVNILLGISTEYRLEHVLFGARSIEEVLVDGPLGMKVIPGASGISECVDLHPRQQLRLTRELARIESQFDYLLVDTAAGISATTLDFISSAHQTLLVITPEPTSLTDAFSLIKLLARRGRRLTFRVVVNMCANANEARQIFHRFSAAVEKYIGQRVQLLGSIQRDESLRSAVSLQHPVALYPDSDPSSRGFLRLAEALHESLADIAAPSSFSAYWQRQYREAESGAKATAEAPADTGSGGQRENPASEAPASARSEPYEERTGDGPERALAEWERQWRTWIASPAVPRELLASTLVSCHEVFWQRFNQPALALPALVARLGDEPQRNAALLEAVRAALPTEPVLDATDAPAVAEPSPSPDTVPALDEAPVPAGLFGRAAAIDSQSEPEPEPEPEPEFERAQAPELPIIHPYDESRFGSQAHLVDLLRRQAAQGRSVAELIAALV